MYDRCTIHIFPRRHLSYTSLLAHTLQIGQRPRRVDRLVAAHVVIVLLIRTRRPTTSRRACFVWDTLFNACRHLSDMPKQRQTCTRCSQRRQKCDRNKTGKAPCTRCVQNNEGHLCSTVWAGGYDPSVHRKYPRKSSPTASWPASSDTTSSLNTPPALPPADQLKLPALTPGTL